tara:strand:- start:774 stop:920 length:147 start_codon:yes stop_codon:yes gene_type:complete
MLATFVPPPKPVGIPVKTLLQVAFPVTSLPEIHIPSIVAAGQSNLKGI